MSGQCSLKIEQESSNKRKMNRDFTDSDIESIFLTDFCFINVTFPSPQYGGLITQAQTFSLLADCTSQVRKVILSSSVGKLDLKESRHILDAFKFQNLFVNIISTPLQVYAQNVHLLI